MIQITKGNPTAEEIAALVAVLALVGATTQPSATGRTTAGWRRTTPPAELNPAAPSRRGWPWRPWAAGWSCVDPAHAPVPHQLHWAETRNVS